MMTPQADMDSTAEMQPRPTVNEGLTGVAHCRPCYERMQTRVQFNVVSVHFRDDGTIKVHLGRYMNGATCQSTDRIDGKVVIVTGSNTGIGKITVEELLKRGGKVYMTCRSLELCQQAARDIESGADVIEPGRLAVMRLDLGSLKSVRNFVDEFKKVEKRLDILVSNAGVVFVPEGKTEDGFETSIGVNHLGHFLLTHLLIDLMIDPTRPGRIVVVSSRAHETGKIHFDDLMHTKSFGSISAYAQSKLANILFARELARRLKDTKVTTYSLHPGTIRTDAGRHLTIHKNGILKFILFYLSWPIIKEPWYGAQTTVCCAVDSSLSTQSGKYYSDCAETEPSAAAQDDDVALKLWNVSIDLVKLKPEEIHEKLR